MAKAVKDHAFQDHPDSTSAQPLAQPPVTAMKGSQCGIPARDGLGGGGAGILGPTAYTIDKTEQTRPSPNLAFPLCPGLS